MRALILAILLISAATPAQAATFTISYDDSYQEDIAYVAATKSLTPQQFLESAFNDGLQTVRRTRYRDIRNNISHQELLDVLSRRN